MSPLWTYGLIEKPSVECLGQSFLEQLQEALVTGLWPSFHHRATPLFTVGQCVTFVGVFLWKVSV